MSSRALITNGGGEVGLVGKEPVQSGFRDACLFGDLLHADLRAVALDRRHRSRRHALAHFDTMRGQRSVRASATGTLLDRSSTVLVTAESNLHASRDRPQGAEPPTTASRRSKGSMCPASSYSLSVASGNDAAIAHTQMSRWAEPVDTARSEDDGGHLAEGIERVQPVVVGDGLAETDGDSGLRRFGHGDGAVDIGARDVFAEQGHPCAAPRTRIRPSLRCHLHAGEHTRHDAVAEPLLRRSIG